MDESVTLREKLKMKLENGEIDQQEYDDLVAKFESMNLLGSTVDHGPKKKVSASGFTRLESEDVDGPVRVSGKLVTASSLNCLSLSISGSANVAGNLKVVETTKVSGRLIIANEAKFGGDVKISGKLEAGDNLYCTDYLKVSGKVNAGGDVVLGSDLKISGKITANGIRSTGSIKLSGKAYVSNDVVAKEFISSGGASTIEGNLEAELIEIAKDFREQFDLSDLEKEANDLDSIPALGTFVAKMVTSFLPGVINTKGFRSPPREFAVFGNVKGDVVDISYTHVKQDLKGINVKIGPKVMVEGTIKYVESIDLPEEHDYIVEQISLEEFNS